MKRAKVKLDGRMGRIVVNILVPFFVVVFSSLRLGGAEPLCPAASRQVPCLTLRDAFERGKQYAGQIQSANLVATLAHEDTAQTRAGLLPTVNMLNQFIYTEGNGTPSGVFVANDGVHVYNEQAVLHQDLFNVVRRADLRRAKAAEAVAQAKRDVAARGLNTTIVQDYYAVAVAQRKLESARSSLRDAGDFLDITRKQQRGGEAAGADTAKAQLQEQQRARELQDAGMAVEKAKVALAVLIFPDITRDFAVEDDLGRTPPLDSLGLIQEAAANSSPDVKAALATVSQSHNETAVARYAYIPSLGVDFFYGINANQFAFNSARAEDTGRSTLPHYEVAGRRNLGYSAAITLNIPIWNWGATQSKVKQAVLREAQAKVDLGVTRKQLRADVQSAYLEAQTAERQLSSLANSVDMARDSLRLTTLKYKAGEATVLEVVDAQTTAVTARNAYADGLLRYRLAVAAIQALTGQLAK